jgi:phosphoglycerate kinase
MKYLSNSTIENKTVILRCDFNVPVSNNVILDDTKIVKSLKSIKYLTSNNNKVILLSHFGRVKTKEDLVNNSLEIVYNELKKYINVSFYKDIFNYDVNNLKYGECVLFENTRFTDIPFKRESANDLELSRYFASLGDVFVMDAFATSHRQHSSTYGISKYLPTFIGFLMEEEITNLSLLVNEPVRPFVVIMGGAKVDDKIPLIKSIISKCDKVILTGGILNSFLKAKGFELGNSLVCKDEEVYDDIKFIIDNYSNKLIFSNCFILEGKNNLYKIEDIGKDDVIIDNIINNIELFHDSKTIFLNGTCGKYEDIVSSIGTKTIFQILSNVNSKVIAGGGDTYSAIRKFNYLDKFYYVSTGGGATLEYIASGKIKVFDE